MKAMSWTLERNVLASSAEIIQPVAVILLIAPGIVMEKLWIVQQLK